MESLVKAGADVNTRRMKDGWTPLFLAGIFGLSYKVQYLLDHGADVLLCDDRGLTVMDWVASYGLAGIQSQLKLAPRRVTETSGKKYVEAEVEDKLQVPVEFDEGINKLLAKLEIKRKARIAEHKNLLMKMEKEKVEEKKRLEDRLQDEPEVSSGTAVVETEDQLTAATDNILQRQRRFLQEMEENGDKVPGESECNLKDSLSQSTTTSRIPPQKISYSQNESKEFVDLNRKSSADVVTLSLDRHLPSDERLVDQQESKTNKTRDCDKKSINTSFKASIDALFQKTAATDDVGNKTEDVLIKEDKSIGNILQTFYSNVKDSEGIPEIVHTNFNSETSLNKNASSKNSSDSIILAEHNKISNIDKNNSMEEKPEERNKQILNDDHSIKKHEKRENHLNAFHGIEKNLALQNGQPENENQEAVKESLLTEIEHEEAQADFGDKSILCIAEIKQDIRSPRNTSSHGGENSKCIEKDKNKKQFGKRKNIKTYNDKKETKSIEESSNKSEKLAKQKKEAQKEIGEKSNAIQIRAGDKKMIEKVNDCNEDTKTWSCEGTLRGLTDKCDNNDRVSDETIEDKRKEIGVDSKKKEEWSPNRNSNSDISGIIQEQSASHKETDSGNSVNLLENSILTGDMIKRDKEADIFIQSPSMGEKVWNKKKVNQNRSGQTKPDGKIELTGITNSEEIEVTDFTKLKEKIEDTGSAKPEDKLEAKIFEVAGNIEVVEVVSNAKPKEKIEISGNIKLDEKIEVTDTTKPLEKIEVTSITKSEKSKEKIEVTGDTKPIDKIEVTGKTNPIEKIEDSRLSKPREEIEVTDIIKLDERIEVSGDTSKENIEVTSNAKPEERIEVTESIKPKEVEVTDGIKPEEKIEVTGNDKHRVNTEVTCPSYEATGIEENCKSKNEDGCENKKSNKMASQNTSQVSEEVKAISTSNDVVEVLGLQENQRREENCPEKEMDRNVELQRESFVKTEEVPLVKTPPCDPSVELTNKSGSEETTNIVKETTGNNLHSSTENDASQQNLESASQAESGAASCLTIGDHVQGSNLPDQIDDAQFEDRLKVFNNYRNFGGMYFAKKNYKKAEWAFKNGIKQTESGDARSREQLRLTLMAEVEFRLSRARSVSPSSGSEGRSCVRTNQSLFQVFKVPRT